MAPKLPDGWVTCEPACGNVIEGTRIICFKVPLEKPRQQFNKEVKSMWTVELLLDKVPKLRSVIDLTNTTRYYNPMDLLSANVRYEKIFLPGRIIPPESTVKEFIGRVNTFLSLNDNESLIGVHCTHGINRTGYMVCRYMRDELKIPAKEAIKRFEAARGCKIERQNYIADLLGKEPPPPDFRSYAERQVSRTEDSKQSNSVVPTNDNDDCNNSPSRYRSRNDYEVDRSRNNVINQSDRFSRTFNSWRNDPTRLDRGIRRSEEAKWGSNGDSNERNRRYERNSRWGTDYRGNGMYGREDGESSGWDRENDRTSRQDTRFRENIEWSRSQGNNIGWNRENKRINRWGGRDEAGSSWYGRNGGSSRWN